MWNNHAYLVFCGNCNSWILWWHVMLADEYTFNNICTWTIVVCIPKLTLTILLILDNQWEMTIFNVNDSTLCIVSHKLLTIHVLLIYILWLKIYLSFISRLIHIEAFCDWYFICFTIFVICRCVGNNFGPRTAWCITSSQLMVTCWSSAQDWRSGTRNSRSRTKCPQWATGRPQTMLPTIEPPPTCPQREGPIQQCIQPPPPTSLQQPCPRTTLYRWPTGRLHPPTAVTNPTGIVNYY